MLAPGLALRAGLGASFLFGSENYHVFARVSHLLGVSLVGGYTPSGLSLLSSVGYWDPEILGF